MLIATLICIAFFLLYSKYLETKYPGYNKKQPPAEQLKQEKDQETAPHPSVPQTAQLDEPSKVLKRLSSEEARFENDKFEVIFDPTTSRITSIKLKTYKESIKKDSPQEELIRAQNFSVDFLPENANANQVLANLESWREGSSIYFSYDLEKWHFEKIYSFNPDSYTFNLKSNVSNSSENERDLTTLMVMKEKFSQEKKSFSLFSPNNALDQTQFLVDAGGSVKRWTEEELCKEDAKEALHSYKSEIINFFGIDRHYFIKTFLPVTNSKFDLTIYPKHIAAADKIWCEPSMQATFRFGLVKPKEKVTLDFKGFFGPKDVSLLKSENKLLTETINLGWFSVIAKPLLSGIQTFYKFCGNYGIAIILITILLKILFYPLTKQAAVSMKAMQKLQPQMQKIKEQFKDNPQVQQREPMKFMGQHKINPAKGCLPILPQIPVFIALYNVLSHAIELRHAPFFGWIQDLSAMDPFFVTPVLLGLAMFGQQKLTPTTGMDPTQQKIMNFMPIIFASMMLTLPSGLVIYMLTNTLVSIGQQRWLNKKLARI